MVKNRIYASVAKNRWATLANLALLAALGLLALLLSANIVFFVIHAAQLLAYPYPLDYGEGPLLQQVNLLRAGTPFWQLYADPAAAPYSVVNYPPVYPLAAWLVSFATGDALLAGRLVSLLAALGAVVALLLLTKDEGRWTMDTEPQNQRTKNQESFAVRQRFLVLGSRLLVVLSFLALPIVREWAVVMRVDMLGVALGLWALVLVQRNVGRRAMLWAMPLLLLSLFTKPSLVAAPGAAVLWAFVGEACAQRKGEACVARTWRRGLLFAGVLALGGGVLVGLLQWASGGWFFFHVVTANANAWQETLARGFWSGQWAIHRTLFFAAALGMAVWLACSVAARSWRALLPLALPLCYTLLGMVSAVGIGKVGAYLNYFLELYAGLVWLVAWTTDDRRWTMARTKNQEPKTAAALRRVFGSWFLVLSLLLLIASLTRYYPTWSQNYLKLAGIIEGANPPRLVLGRYGVWQDLQRERAVLATLGRVNAALVNDVRATNAPIFTDVPGVAAQAGQLSRLQAFEHRQLHDLGVWDQRGLLRDMANGRVPLVVLDYLGNWLTPEMITLLTQRYAQSGSRGTYDSYQPVDSGPRVAADIALADGLRLSGYHLAPPVSGNAYDFGETVLLTLEMVSDGTACCAPEVVVQLTDSDGRVITESTRPLLGGALPPSTWQSGETVQHMQPLTVPPELLPGTYTLAVALRAGMSADAPPQPLATITVAAQGGRVLGDYFVPASFLGAWQQWGADAALGPPLMPAVPFAGFAEQCFARGCLVLRDGQVARLPLGELVLLGDVEGTAARSVAGTPALAEQFAPFYAAQGGAAALGPPITAPFMRGEWLVQYTRYARLEQSQQTGETRLASLGVDYLRLPGGTPYRWP